MNRDLEHALRAALKSVDPGDAFTRQVLSRLASEPPPRAHFAGWGRLWERPALLALAASVLLAVAGAGLWQGHRVRQGERARLQLLEALRVTDQTLAGAYRAANEPSASRTSAGRAGT